MLEVLTGGGDAAELTAGLLAGLGGKEVTTSSIAAAAVRSDGHQIAALGPGDFFGDLALVGHGERTATVTAETDIVLHVMNRRKFSALLAETPIVAYKILMGAAQRLHQQMDAASLN